MADFPQRPPFFHFFFKEHVLNPVHQNKNYIFSEHQKAGYNLGKNICTYEIGLISPN